LNILVAAKRVDIDRTSEGICTSKVLAALRNLGHQVECIAGEGCTPDGPAPVPGVAFYPLESNAREGVWARMHNAIRPLASRGSAGRYLSNRINLALAVSTGYDAPFWSEVEHWRAALQRRSSTARPDVVLVRSAGIEFQPHVAALQGLSDLPWVANYHDPYPYSLYPEPYRIRVPLLSSRQEAQHRRIVLRASALTFPSRRLLEWVLTGDLESCRKKAFVVPHVAMPLSNAAITPAAPAMAALDSNLFHIVHTGTLLPQRSPRALLEGFIRFVDQDEEHRAKARLLFIGRIDRRHAADARLQAAFRHPNISCVAARIPYCECLAAARASAAAAIIESAGPVSPFFPAKLADYLWLRKPILALTPKQSVVTDLLGSAYPLLVEPADEIAVIRALELLWNAWKHGALGRLLPPEDAIAAVSEDSAGRRLQDVLQAVAAREMPPPRRPRPVESVNA
jgi:hypothetical protein